MDAHAFLMRLGDGTLVGDGASGSLLQAWGLPADSCPDAWNLDNPEAVARIAAEYRAAGSDIVQTNTFRSNAITLAGWGLEGKVAELNAAGVRLARQGAPGALVAGSIGPCGKLLEPLGDFPAEEAVAAFREQAEALAAAGADLLIVETFYALDEAGLAVEAAASTGLAVLATMSFEPSGRTMMGVTPSQATSLTGRGAVGVGLNCGGVGLEQVAALVSEFAAATSAPIVVQPNAGVAQLVDGRTVFPEPPAAMGRWAPEYRRRGARVIGGCCGTTPAHLAAVSAALRHA